MAGNYILIEEGTSFNGTLTAKKVVIAGYVEGDVHAAQKVLIKSEGIVNGCIRTEKLLFEKGGQHSGLVHLGSESMLQKENSSTSPNSSQVKKYVEGKQNKEHEPVLENAGEEKNEKRLW